MTTQEQIKNIAAKLHISEKKAWNIYFESGFDFIENLKKSIGHFQILKSQFGYLITSGKLDGLSITETFRRIQNSPYFWGWWLSQLWAMANDNYEFNIIPSNVITKIFENNEFKPKRQKMSRRSSRKVRKPEGEVIDA